MVELLVPGTVLVAGLVLLWWAGDRSVRYSTELSDLLGISSFTVGFLVISISTAVPELTTAVVSAMDGVAGLSAGDIIGSSFVNLSLILGVTILASGTLKVSWRHEKLLVKILALITVLAAGVVFWERLSVWHGAVLVSAYAGSVLYLRNSGIVEKIVKEETDEAEEELMEETVFTGLPGTLFKLAGSLLVVVMGARLTVTSAVDISTGLGIPLETLGATVVAVGTGLPELSLELNAVKRKEYALALGDIFGATLVQLTLTLGLLSVLSPSHINIFPLIGTVAYLGLAIGFLGFTLLHNHQLETRHGVILVIIFCLYMFEELGFLSLV